MASTEKLIIPVQESNEVVVVPINQLPEVPDDVLDVLTCEAAPLSIWFDFARAYLANNKVEHYLYILNEGTSKEVAQEAEKFFGQKPIYEQIQFYCGLAAYNIVKAREEKDKNKKNDMFAKASNYLLQAKSLNPAEQLPYIGTGLLAFAKGQPDEAKREFNTAMLKTNNNRPNILGYLAMAALLFSQKQYLQALGLYKKAVREHPGCPAEVRLGIAACQFKMGNLVKAEAAYQRVMELDPGCAEAYLGLAVIKFNSSNVQQGLADGCRLLSAAYALDPGNPACLSLLAHLCLLRGDYDKVLVLAKSGLEAADSDPLKAECLTLLARAHHALGRYNEASTLYVQASRLDSSLALPHLGLAQMYLRAGPLVNACSELEAAVKLAGNFYDALKMLGRLLPSSEGEARGRADKVAATVASFKDATSKKPQDADLWEMLGELLSTTDPAGSLAAYKKSLELHRKKQADVEAQRKDIEAAAAARRGQKKNKKGKKAKRHDEFDEDDLFGDESDEGGSEESEESEGEVERQKAAIPDHHIPAKMLNNAAVLFYRAGDHEGALALFEEANKCMARVEGEGGVTELQQVTLSFNMARLREALGDFKSARKGYTDILAKFPGYIDCYLRMACIARSTSNMRAALDWVQQALEREGRHSDTLALMAALHMERREWDKAKDILTKLLSLEENKDDKYALLLQANRYLYKVPSDRRGPKAKAAEEGFKAALDLYRRVLERDRHNVFAANGIGAVLAEQGNLDAAKDIFISVQEAAAASGGFLRMPDVWVNLANIHLAKQEYVSAVRMYQNLLTKFHNNKSAQVLLYLARAHYDSDDLMAAKRCLSRAVHVVPTDYKLRFNAAVTMQEYAVRVFRRKRPTGDDTKLEEYRNAATELDHALKCFAHLNTLGGEATGIAPNKVLSHIEFCEAQRVKFQDWIQQAEEEYKEMAARRELQVAALRVEQDKKDFEETRRKRAEEKARREREEAARRAIEREAALRQQWQQAASFAPEEGEGGGKKEKKKRKRDKKAEEQDWIQDEVEYRDDDEQQAPEDGEYGGGDGDEGAQDLMAQAGLASDDEDDHKPPPKAAAKKGGAPRKRLRQDKGAAAAPSRRPSGAYEEDDEEDGQLVDPAATGLYDSEEEQPQQNEDEEYLDDSAPTDRRRGRTFDNDDDGDDDF